MKLFVPEIGTVLKLEQNWTFTLFGEGRNEALCTAAELAPGDINHRKPGFGSATLRGWTDQSSGAYWPLWAKDVVLPAGTILTVDRIYIRKGLGTFSSLSFNLTRKSVNPDFSVFARRINTTRGRCRFWAKLNDVNKIEFIDP